MLDVTVVSAQLLVIRNCGKVGHLASICRHGARNEPNFRFKGQQYKAAGRSRAHQITELPLTKTTVSPAVVPKEENDHRLYTLSVNQAHIKLIVVDLHVLGQKVSLKLILGRLCPLCQMKFLRGNFLLAH